MNARKATELRQVEVAPAGRLSRYRESLRVSTKLIKLSWISPFLSLTAGRSSRGDFFSSAEEILRVGGRDGFCPRKNNFSVLFSGYKVAI